MSESEMADRIDVITDLLMGAAYSDGSLEGREEATVRRLLGELLDGAALPAATDARIAAFSTEGFDLEETAAHFRDDSPERKRKLLELVVAVRDADDVFDTDEDDYMTALARALGMKPEEYADLALQIEELRSSLDEVRRSMPPVLLTARKN
ncbi:MAG: TerB family tellurite resistance protein [Deltaproteobacteria bacterium]|jgi:tellurite resistance protein|nr:TerB family tellurite resistance protein [Deltaproteobacteria bacterium]MBP6832376.1 TerB family tellurite resistance protein [Deltaproteobacteria bacterium]